MAFFSRGTVKSGHCNRVEHEHVWFPKTGNVKVGKKSAAWIRESFKRILVPCMWRSTVPVVVDWHDSASVHCCTPQFALFILILHFVLLTASLISPIRDNFPSGLRGHTKFSRLEYVLCLHGWNDVYILNSHEGPEPSMRNRIQAHWVWDYKVLDTLMRQRIRRSKLTIRPHERFRTWNELNARTVKNRHSSVCNHKKPW